MPECAAFCEGTMRGCFREAAMMGRRAEPGAAAHARNIAIFERACTTSEPVQGARRLLPHRHHRRWELAAAARRRWGGAGSRSKGASFWPWRADHFHPPTMSMRANGQIGSLFFALWNRAAPFIDTPRQTRPTSDAHRTCESSRWREGYPESPRIHRPTGRDGRLAR
jgi:hypothetical protein